MYLEIETQLKVVESRHFGEQNIPEHLFPRHLALPEISYNATVLTTKPAAVGDSSAVLSWRRGCWCFLLVRGDNFLVFPSLFTRENDKEPDKQYQNER